MNNQSKQELNKFGHVIFWLLWTLSFVIFPFYLFTFLFEIDKVKPGITSSYFSPVIGALVLILQITIVVISFQQMKQGITLSKPYLTLLGGTILVGFIWAGGCSIMGPWHL